MAEADVVELEDWGVLVGWFLVMGRIESGGVGCVGVVEELGGALLTYHCKPCVGDVEGSPVGEGRADTGPPPAHLKFS